MLKGNLSGFSLGEIFQSLAINKHTGTLTIKTGASPKHIYFEDGEIRFFSHGSPQTPRIGEILLRSGVLTAEQLERALREAKSSGKLVGKVLLEHGFVQEQDIRDSLARKICEELYELFSHEEGEFEFHLDSCPEEVFDQLQKSVKVSISTNSVIMEGLRRIDEWQIIHTRIRTENEIFTQGDEPLAEDASMVLEEVHELLDGQKPVAEISKDYPGTKFELFKAIFDLLERGASRPLALDELMAAAGAAKKERNYPEAAAHLRFASELDPDSPQIFMELGEALGKFYQEKQAEHAYIAALKLYWEQGDWDQAAATAEMLPPNADLHPDDLQMLLQTFIELRQIKKALWAGQQLATSLQKRGEAQKAAEILDSLIEVDPADLNLKVQVATLFQQVGEAGRATEYFEEVADTLEQQKKIKDQIKILRMLLEVNPKRVEIKQKINTLIALQERLERQRKRRLTIAGGSIIGLIVFAVVPLIYELKARELFSHAWRMEQIALQTGDYTQARKAYEELLRDYSLSTRRHEAKLSLDRIRDVEANQEKTARVEIIERQRQIEEQQRSTERQITEAQQAARIAESKGDLDEAHRLYRRAHELAKPTRLVHKLALPLLIQSKPTAATVVINGQDAGRTPVIVRYRPGEQISLRLERRGCDPLEDRVTLSEERHLHFDLPRRPMTEIVLPSTFTQPAHHAGIANVFLFPSRDGKIYGYDPDSHGIVLQKSVGDFGDKLSDLHVRSGYVYVGTVDDALISFHVKTGKRKWPARQIRGPILAAPVTSEDEEWLAAANIFGEVYIIDNRTGRIAGTFATENEIVAAPLFVGGYVLVGCRDDYVYAYSLKQGKVVFIAELESDVETDPVRFASDAIFATLDGKVHRIDTAARRVTWSVRVTRNHVAELATTHDRILAALSTGSVLSLDPRTGAVLEEWEITESTPGGITVSGNLAYIGYENGLLVAWNIAEGRLDWKWQADASILTPPLVLDGKLYVACRSGTVQVLEID